MLQLRSPVRREGAERYLLLTLISFAASVVLTRTYLEMTGYPQIGSGALHIAHVVWGGLLLFLATLAPIIFANRWAYRVAAVLGGVGVGLFIDEVGKFITQSNDYFFPLAAPIIYAFFLLTVMIYLQIRRPSRMDSRSELYSALDQIMELIENDLDHAERASLEARLMRVIRDARIPEHVRLAEALLAVINSDTLYIAPPNPNIFQRASARFEALEARLINQARYRLLLIAGLALAGIGSLVEFAVFAGVLLSRDWLEFVATVLLLDEKFVNSPTSITWFLVLLALGSITGVMMLTGGALMLVRRERLGSELGYLGLVISLTTVTLLLFYFDQFAAVSSTLMQFILLIALLRYRRMYLGTGSGIEVLSSLSKTPEESDE
ncbi:MAG: hypothetical protein IT319_22885 [Anaerolineae bacterium]|nr:hypothetical protein [Anaerolineae bacterium]